MQTAIPASQATILEIIKFPGKQISGESVLDTLTEDQPKRIPTIFAPFYANTRFNLEPRETPPGTTLHLTNMTFMIANATYGSLSASGVMDYFEFGTSARACMTNRYAFADEQPLMRCSLDC
jgi:hypothetical protein